MVRLDFFDHQILRLLVREHRWMNANQVAEKLDIAWLTANVHLKELVHIGYVVMTQKRGLRYYRANI